MSNQLLPDITTMQRAFYQKDCNFEGIFFVAVKTTGIFCRPTCSARKPREKNIEFFSSTHEAILQGYRPCKICRPLEYKGAAPKWLRPLLEEIQLTPDIRLKDQDLRKRSIEPNRVRRWFKKHHGMTFQAYLRTLRISQAFSRIREGNKVIEAAYDSGYNSLSGFTEFFKKTTGFSPNRSSQRQLIRITRLTTPLGPMLAGANEQGIYLLEFADRRMLETQVKRLKKYLSAEFLPGTSPHFELLQTQISDYFNGKLKKFSVSLMLTGTPFQKRVWKILQNIPYGSTRSYQQQAEILGQPNAVRAVARANGDNKIAIIIPCHRVIGSRGELVGYGGGLWRKKYLLQMEKGNIAKKHQEKNQGSSVNVQ